MPELIVNIDVEDLEAGVRFYTRALGLRVGRRLEGGYTELLGSPTPVFLTLAPAGTRPFAGAPQPRAYARHWTPLHLDLVVDDIEAALARAVAAGAKVEQPIVQHAYGKLAILGDPFGHGFCLLQLEGKGYDAVVAPEP